MECWLSCIFRTPGPANVTRTDTVGGCGSTSRPCHLCDHFPPARLAFSNIESLQTSACEEETLPHDWTWFPALANLATCRREDGGYTIHQQFVRQSAAFADRMAWRTSRHISDCHDDGYTGICSRYPREVILILCNLSMLRARSAPREGRVMLPLFRVQSPIRFGPWSRQER